LFSGGLVFSPAFVFFFYYYYYFAGGRRGEVSIIDVNFSIFEKKIPRMGRYLLELTTDYNIVVMIYEQNNLPSSNKK
jgi:hypothetical protein